MSTAVAKTNDATVVEKVVLQGDLSQLGPEERVNYYHQLCDYLGLNAVTQPFKILRLSGKDVLYATKDATEQLRKKNSVSIDQLDGKQVGDVYIVTAKGHDGHGRTDMATGAVTIGNAKGDALANLLMKAETKAKRRLTLSICGLGVLDETEIETIPSAEKPVEPTGSVKLDDTAGVRKELLARAALCADSGHLNEGEIAMYRGECRDAKDNDTLLSVVEEMEKATELAEQRAYKDKEPFADERVGTEPDDGADEAFGTPSEKELF